MEQEGGVGGRAGPQAPPCLLAPPRLTHHLGALRDCPHSEGAGVLLRQHELHEGLPAHHPSLLQRCVLVPGAGLGPSTHVGIKYNSAK